MTKQPSSPPPTSSNRANRREQQRQREVQRRRRLYLAIGVIAVGVITLIALIWWTNRPKPFVLAAVHTEQPPNADGSAWGGPEGAAVTIEEYSDFQCPFCGRHALQTVPALIEKYGDNPNVRYVFKPYPFIGNESVDAAAAAVCASEQGLFWPYHDTLFANQQGENQGQFAKNNLKEIAKAIGADTGSFNECFDSGRQRAAVLDTLQEGRDRGVTSTPIFFVNDQKIEGAQPAAVFITAIDQALAAAGVQ